MGAVIIGYLVSGIIFGLIAKHVAESKGYDGGFWWGFFLGLIGLVVVEFRPNINTSESTNYEPRYGNSPSCSSYSSLNSNNNTTGTWFCECGATNSNSLNYCLRCRRDRSPASYQPKITCPHCGAQNRATNINCFACNKPLKEEPIQTKEVASEPNNIDLLQQLSKLHEQGILTDEEFQTKKAEILSKM